jgi:hypothetical protein
VAGTEGHGRGGRTAPLARFRGPAAPNNAWERSQKGMPCPVEGCDEDRAHRRNSRRSSADDNNEEVCYGLFVASATSIGVLEQCRGGRKRYQAGRGWWTAEVWVGSSATGACLASRVARGQEANGSRRCEFGHSEGGHLFPWVFFGFFFCRPWRLWATSGRAWCRCYGAAACAQENRGGGEGGDGQKQEKNQASSAESRGCAQGTDTGPKKERKT